MIQRFPIQGHGMSCHFKCVNVEFSGNLILLSAKGDGFPSASLIPMPGIALDGLIDGRMPPHNVKWLGREWASLSHPWREPIPNSSSLFLALFLIDLGSLSPKLSEGLKGRWVSTSSPSCMGATPLATSLLPPRHLPPSHVLTGVCHSLLYSFLDLIWLPVVGVSTCTRAPPL